MEVSSEHRGSLWGLRSGRSGPHRLDGIFVRIRAPGRKHSIHLQCLPKLVALRELRRTVGAREFLCGGGIGGARRGNYLFISKSGSYNFCTCVLEFLTVKVMEKLKIFHMAKMSNFWIFIKKTPKSCNHRDTYTSMFIAALCTIAQLWKAQVPIHSRTNKENMVYTCNAILFGHKEKWDYDSCKKIDEPGDNCIKQMRLVSERQMLYVLSHLWITYFI